MRGVRLVGVVVGGLLVMMAGAGCTASGGEPTAGPAPAGTAAPDPAATTPTSVDDRDDVAALLLRVEDVDRTWRAERDDRAGLAGISLCEAGRFTADVEHMGSGTAAGITIGHPEIGIPTVSHWAERFDDAGTTFSLMKSGLTLCTLQPWSSTMVPGGRTDWSMRTTEVAAAGDETIAFERTGVLPDGAGTMATLVVVVRTGNLVEVFSTSEIDGIHRPVGLFAPNQRAELLATFLARASTR